MAETAPAQAEKTSVNPYEDMSRETVEAIANVKASVDADSSTPYADLRTATREALESSGDERAFRRVYDMNNQELDAFVDGAHVESKDRRVGELRALIDAYDNNESFADRRTAIREALEAAGDTKAFRTVYDMNNLDLTAFINDARQKLEGETRMDEAEALENAYTEYEEREGTPYDVDKDRVKDSEEARVLAGVEEITRTVRANPEAAEKAGIYDKLRDVLAEIEAALAAAKASEELEEPKDTLSADDEALEEPKDSSDLKADEEELEEPKDELHADDEELEEPKDELHADDESLEEPKDSSDLKTDGRDDTKELDKVEEDKEHLSRWRHPFAYVGALFTVEGGSALERFRSSKKGKAVVVIGAIAVVGGLIAGRHYGWFGFGGGNHHDAANGYTPGQKGGHPGGTGVETPPPVVPKGPEVPGGDHYAHPWNWMTAAMDNGSITPPKGMSAEQALHHYGTLAEKAGHDVQWHSLPNGLESISIDGSDSTKDVADVLTQFAK
jgi:hypothetical protein